MGATHFVGDSPDRVVGRRLRALAVCEGPPQEKSPLDFVLPNAQVIDCRKGFDAYKFEPFLTHL